MLGTQGSKTALPIGAIHAARCFCRCCVVTTTTSDKKFGGFDLRGLFTGLYASERSTHHDPGSAGAEPSHIERHEGC